TARRALGQAHQPGGDSRELVSAVPWQIPGCGEQQAVRRHGNRVGDAGYPIGEVGQKPAEILRSCHASCSLPPCGGFPGVVDSGFFASSAVRVRPRCTPRWYAESRPRTSSGRRRLAVVATSLSSPPGTSWAIGTRRGRPAEVVPSACGSAACLAADQPSSAAVCQAGSPVIGVRVGSAPVPLGEPPSGTAGGAGAGGGTSGGGTSGGGTNGCGTTGCCWGGGGAGCGAAAGGADAGAGGPVTAFSGLRGRVWNQADSNSREIGRSMVSSAYAFTRAGAG